jgi:C-terminal processing protease CtpA/Prc
MRRYVFSRFNYRPQPQVQSKVVPPTVGYVNLNELRVGDVKRVMKQYKNHRGIIFDVRGYPKGTFLRLGKYLNPEPRGFARYTQPDLLRPGLFKWTKIQYVGQKNPDYYQGKVAILCNSQTQSAAESTCMALRTAPHAKIIGTQSAGANGDVSYVRFPGGYQTRFSGRGVYTMDGQLVLGPGIPIDIVAKQSSEDALTGTDRAIQTAIDWISQ